MTASPTTTLCCDFEDVRQVRHGLGLTLRRFWHRHHSRQQLLSLTDTQLRDLGMTRDQITREALKPFWR
jgi:uncharacterized protein YjiS (DUF1127 family)